MPKIWDRISGEHIASRAASRAADLAAHVDSNDYYYNEYILMVLATKEEVKKAIATKTNGYKVKDYQAIVAHEKYLLVRFSDMEGRIKGLKERYGQGEKGIITRPFIDRKAEMVEMKEKEKDKDMEARDVEYKYRFMEYKNMFARDMADEDLQAREEESVKCLTERRRWESDSTGRPHTRGARCRQGKKRRDVDETAADGTEESFY